MNEDDGEDDNNGYAERDVLQSSHLGPKFFIIDTIDMVEFIELDHDCFADDTKIYRKCCVMVFNKGADAKLEANYHINNTQLEKITETKDRGIIDSVMEY
ncbi:Protein of unknown function [Cotesia congregata]|uniref:Uncharacterized protein n=1 Tax=Cotesia congregata TaxID=51543 RepID=A0A8J2HC88_COTCN|nr:Protein of unknown function [Cotesia congregata]